VYLHHHALARQNLRVTKKCPQIQKRTKRHATIGLKPTTNDRNRLQKNVFSRGHYSITVPSIIIIALNAQESERVTVEHIC